MTQLRLIFLSSLALVSLLTAASRAHTQEIPPELEGDWGEPQQCRAQEDVGASNTVASAADAPYRLRGQWLSRWFFYCRVLRINPVADMTYRAGVLCGEDAIERRWEVDIVRESDTLTMTWFAIDEDDGVWRPWLSGPFQRCDDPQS